MWRATAMAVVLVVAAFAAMTVATTIPSIAEAAPRKKKVRRKPRARVERLAPSSPKAVAALGRAFRAYRSGDYAAALKAAAPLARAKLRNRDYALYVAAQSAALSGNAARALRLFERLANDRDSRFREIAPWRAADCLWALGRRDEARRAYERLLPPTRGSRRASGDVSGGDLPIDVAIALARIAESHEREGERAHAVQVWRRLALELPEHPLAADAEARLASIGQPLDERDRLERAQRLSNSRGWEEALAELDRIDPAAVSEDLRIEREYWIATTLFRMRRQYERAGRILLRIHERVGDRAASALFHGARALSRADKDTEAIRWYHKVVEKYPKSRYAEEAQFLAGWLEFNRGRYAQGIPDLEQVLRRYPRSRWVDDALWYLAFSHHLLGRPAQALPYLERLTRSGSGALRAGKARYWKARALAALGRHPEGIAALRDIVGDYPFSWYALLARARLREAGVTIGPFGDARRDNDAVARLDAVDPAATRDPLIGRVDELIRAGLSVEAGVELRRGERAYLDRWGSARGLPVVLDRYRDAGNWSRPWALAAVYGRRAFEGPPKGPARRWWEHAYPLAYRDLVEKHQRLGKNPPYYLYAIMRKESGFDPHVLSYAEAIGLLQMIPPTTRRVAAAMGLEYTDDLLFDPDKNIKVASWYIGHLVQKFKLQIPIASGSYNSGPRPVMRWLDKHGERPLDEWIELVSYTQTREYMKKVTDYYARYLYLYEGIDYQQPLTVDPEYVRDELTY